MKPIKLTGVSLTTHLEWEVWNKFVLWAHAHYIRFEPPYTRGWAALYGYPNSSAISDQILEQL